MRQLTVEVPTNGVIVERTGKYRYVYKVTRTYRNESGKPSCDKRSIGRLSDDERLIPNSTYFEFYNDIPSDVPQPDLNGVTVKSIGASFLMLRIFKALGVDDVLRSVFGPDRSKLILSLATYMACRGNIIEYISNWCEEYYLGQNLSPQTASIFFTTITHNDKMEFFKEWVKRNLTDSYLAYDVTSLSCYGKDIEDAEWGYNRDGDKLPQINLGCYLQQQTGLPVFYVTYPGSIVGKSHMPYMMEYNEELGIHDVTFVMDKRFCTTENLKWLHSNNICYVIAVDKFHKTTRAAIDRVHDGLVSMRYRIKEGIYGRNICSQFYGVPSFMHILYNNELAEAQRTDLFRLVETYGETLSQREKITKKEARKYKRFFDINIEKNCNFTYNINHDKVNHESVICGYFCILTNIKESSSNILNIYRRKDKIEKGFDDIKNYIDMKRIRTHSDNSTRGKTFCAFIALIAASQIAETLHAFNQSSGHRRLSKINLVSELEKIKVIVRPGRIRLMNPITKLQRDLLTAFGLSETELQAFISDY
jgi:transposase